MNAKVKGTAFALFGGACWGLSSVVGKLLFDMRGMNAEWLVTARLVFGGFIMLCFAAFQKKGEIFKIWKEKKTAFSMILFAALGMLACQLTYFLCVQYSNPATATVLQYTSPVMIMLLCLFLDRKLPRIIDIIVLIAVVVGVFLMSTHGNIHSLAISQKALILGITTAITVVFYTVWPVRLLREYGSTLVIGWGMFIGGIMLMPFSKFWAPPGRWDWVTVTLVAIVVVFGTIVSFSCYLKGVMYLGPVKSSLFACMEPLVSTILTIFLLHQAFVAADIVGIALIIVSVTSLAVNDVIKEESEYLDYFFDKSYDNLKGYLEKFILQIKKRYAKEEQNSMQFILRMAYMPPLHLKEEVINNFNIYFLKLENLIKDLFLEDLFLEEKANMATLSFMNMLNGLLVTLIYGGCERFDLKFKASWKVYWAGLNKE